MIPRETLPRATCEYDVEAGQKQGIDLQVVLLYLLCARHEQDETRSGGERICTPKCRQKTVHHPPDPSGTCDTYEDYESRDRYFVQHPYFWY